MVVVYLIITYDVGEERVSKLHKILSQYLHWVQNSVFEGEVTKAACRELEEEIKSFIEPDHDSIYFYKLKHEYVFEKETYGCDKGTSSTFI